MPLNGGLKGAAVTARGEGRAVHGSAFQKVTGGSRCPVTGGSTRRQIRGNTGALEPAGGGDWSPGICAGDLPALCWADRALGFYEETLIKRLSPNPCPIVLHSPPHPILSLAAPLHLSAKGPVGPREFHVHPFRLPSLSSASRPEVPHQQEHGISWLFTGRGKEELPTSPRNALGGPSHAAGSHLCRQGHQPVLVSAEVARTCPGCPQNFGAAPCARAVRTAAM